MIEIKFTPAQNQWLEVTWTDVVQAPDVETPASPALYDAEGNEVQPAVAASTAPGEITRTELKHVSYHPTQLDLRQADAAAMGTPLDDNAHMLAEWTASYEPPAPVPVQVPQVLTAPQAKLVLHKAGLLDDVDAAVAASDKATQIEWEYATEVRRDWPTLVAMAAALGMTDAQLDGLFAAGALL